MKSEIVESSIEEKNNDGAVEINALSQLIQSVVQPLSDSQSTAAKEATKQTKIIVENKLKMFWGVCGLIVLIILLSALALFLDKSEITQNIIIAIVSFLGGLGFGKQLNN